MRTIVTSGYFNPLHIGHVQLLEQAKALGDRLVVIVNNDEQVRLKGSVPFMSEAERLAIVLSLKCVDEARVSIDTDRTVKRTLESIGKFDIFAKGGDSTLDNVPEWETCRKLGAVVQIGVGGEKVQSSSWLLRPAVQKPWGAYTLHEKGLKHWIKTLTIKPGQATSLQSHEKRREIWVCVEGIAIATYGGQYEYEMHPGDTLHIEEGSQHRIASEVGCKLVEVAYGDPDENDIKRFSDKYGRA